jgi:trimethylamine--corrinoid protein Co-methyltransferase
MEWNRLKGAYIEFFSIEDMDAIHATTLKILKDIGLNVTSDQALEIYSDAGADVNRSSKMVKFNENIIDEAIAATPETFIWQARNPDKNLVMGDTTVHFAAAACPPFVHDLDTGQRRPATYQDCINMVKLEIALERVCDSFCPVFPQDIPEGTANFYMMRAMVENSDKCLRGRINGAQVALDSIKIAKMVEESTSDEMKGPNMLALTDTISPLRTDDLIVDGLIEYVKQGYPVILSSEIMAGGSGPATLAGTLALQNAEILSHVVLCQKINPGIPLIYGTTSSIMDMKTGNLRYGAVEMGMINAATAQLSRYYGMPCRGAAGCSDSKILDMQAGYETGINILLAALGGVNYLMQTIGCLEMGMAVNYEKIIIDHDILGSIVRCLEGIRVDSESLAFDVIRNVGAGGTFLTVPHTLESFRREHFISELADTSNLAQWVEEGSQRIENKAKERVKDILANHKPNPLSDNVITELDQMEQEVKKRAASQVR